MISAGPTREIFAVRFILMDALLFLALPEEEEEDGSEVSAPSGSEGEGSLHVQPGCHEVSLHPCDGALLLYPR